VTGVVVARVAAVVPVLRVRRVVRVAGVRVTLLRPVPGLVRTLWPVAGVPTVVLRPLRRVRGVSIVLGVALRPVVAMSGVVVTGLQPVVRLVGPVCLVCPVGLGGVRCVGCVSACALPVLRDGAGGLVIVIVAVSRVLVVLVGRGLAHVAASLAACRCGTPVNRIPPRGIPAGIPLSL